MTFRMPPRTTVDRTRLARKLSQASPGSPFAAQLRKAAEPHRLSLDQLETELHQHHHLGHLLRPDERQIYEPVRSILSARELFSNELPGPLGPEVKKAAPTRFVAPTQAWSSPVEDAIGRPVLGRDGAELFQLSRTGELFCFDPHNGDPTRSLRLSSGLTTFNEPQLTPDGKHLIISGMQKGSTLWKINLDTLAVEWKRERMAGEYWGTPAVGPDGTVSATVRGESQLEVLDPQTGKTQVKITLEKHSFDVAFPRFSADGERLHFSYRGADGKARHYGFDARTGEELWSHVPDSYQQYVWSILHGDTLLAFGDGKLEAIDSRSGVQLWETAMPVTASWYPPALSPDGKLMALPVQKGMALIDTSDGSVRQQFDTLLQQGDFATPVFTEDGAALIAHDNLGHHQRVEIDTGTVTPVGERPMAMHPYSDGYAVAPGGRWSFHTYDRQLTAVELKPNGLG
jgi:outer membrane protein assembly factor BamB